MKIREAIDRVDAVKPNTFSISEKVRWLSYLDGVMLTDTVDTHEQTDAETGQPIEEPEPIDTLYDADHLDAELIAPYPYDELYVAYLKMKIDEENGETQRYNNSATLFNSYYSNFIKAYHRAHKPLVHHIDYR